MCAFQCRKFGAIWTVHMKNKNCGATKRNLNLVGRKVAQNYCKFCEKLTNSIYLKIDNPIWDEDCKHTENLLEFLDIFDKRVMKCTSVHVFSIVKKCDTGIYRFGLIYTGNRTVIKTHKTLNMLPFECTSAFQTFKIKKRNSHFSKYFLCYYRIGCL